MKIASLNSDFNFSVSPEELDEKGKEILRQFRIIEDALNEIEKAKSGLQSWQSENKEIYETKLNNILPKMNEISKTIESYGKVAEHASICLKNAENKISKIING